MLDISFVECTKGIGLSFVIFGRDLKGTKIVIFSNDGQYDDFFILFSPKLFKALNQSLRVKDLHVSLNYLGYFI